MSEAEMNSYRFNSGQEPTDEMLAQIMPEAAADAKKRHEVRDISRSCAVEQLSKKHSGATFVRTLCVNITDVYVQIS